MIASRFFSTFSHHAFVLSLFALLLSSMVWNVSWARTIPSIPASPAMETGYYWKPRLEQDPHYQWSRLAMIGNVLRITLPARTSAFVAPMPNIQGASIIRSNASVLTDGQSHWLSIPPEMSVLELVLDYPRTQSLRIQAPQIERMDLSLSPDFRAEGSFLIFDQRSDVGPNKTVPTTNPEPALSTSNSEQSYWLDSALLYQFNAHLRVDPEQLWISVQVEQQTPNAAAQSLVLAIQGVSVVGNGARLNDQGEVVLDLEPNQTRAQFEVLQPREGEMETLVLHNLHPNAQTIWTFQHLRQDFLTLDEQWVQNPDAQWQWTGTQTQTSPLGLQRKTPTETDKLFLSSLVSTPTVLDDTVRWEQTAVLQTSGYLRHNLRLSELPHEWQTLRLNGEDLSLPSVDNPMVALNLVPGTNRLELAWTDRHTGLVRSVRPLQIQWGMPLNQVSVNLRQPEGSNASLAYWRAPKGTQGPLFLAWTVLLLLGIAFFLFHARRRAQNQRYSPFQIGALSLVLWITPLFLTNPSALVFFAILWGLLSLGSERLATRPPKVRLLYKIIVGFFTFCFVLSVLQAIHLGLVGKPDFWAYQDTSLIASGLIPNQTLFLDVLSNDLLPDAFVTYWISPLFWQALILGWGLWILSQIRTMARPIGAAILSEIPEPPKSQP